MKPFRILFVDDEEINILNFRVAFKDRYELFTAMSGEEGLAMFQETDDIGLIISDQRMNGMTGSEMLGKIYHLNPDPIRILLTAHSQIEYIMDAVNRGHVYQYILKPWLTRDLNLVIERARDLYFLKKENSSLAEELAEKNRNLELVNQKLIGVNEELKRDVQRRKQLESYLRESEEKFRKFAQASQDMIFLCDSQCNGVYNNPICEKLLGYKSSELRGNLADLMLGSEDHQWVVEGIATLLHSDETPQPREILIKKKDQDWLEAELSFFRIDLESGEQIVGSVVRDITQRKAAERKLLLSEERLGDLSAMLITAQDDERRRISMELHDEFGQSLAALKLQLRALENGLSAAEGCQKQRALEGLRELRQFVNVQIESIRHLSRELWPMIVDDLGLEAAFEHLFSVFQDHNAFEIRSHMIPVDDLFPVEQQRHIYRLFQEALNNVLKHSGATTVSILAEEREGGVALSIHDNGCGFDVEEISSHTGKSRGMGLQAMSERIKILNGRLNINSSPGKGSSIYFILDLESNS